jgi:hypothetical protein
VFSFPRPLAGNAGRVFITSSAARVLLVCGAIPLPVKYLSAARSSPFQRIAAGPVDDPARALSRIANTALGRGSHGRATERDGVSKRVGFELTSRVGRL